MIKTQAVLDYKKPEDLTNFDTSQNAIMRQTLQSEKSHKTDERGDKRDKREHSATPSANDVKSQNSRKPTSQHMSQTIMQINKSAERVA